MSQALYESRRSRYPGSPEYAPEIEAIVPYMVEGRTLPWDSLLEEVARIQATNHARVNPVLPVFQAEDGTGAGMSYPEHAQDQLIALCAQTSPSYALEIMPVLDAWLRILPFWYHAPANTDGRSNGNEFIFFRLRCMISGAGYEAWPILSVIAMHLCPACDFDPEETREEWGDALKEAHQRSGWPTAYIWLPWTELPDAGDPWWLAPLAYLHVLKHTRRINKADVLIAYQGRQDTLQGKSQYIGHWKEMAKQVFTVLATDPKSEKGLCLSQALNHIGLTDLLPQTPLFELPGCILFGPWSGSRPGPRNSGFFQIDRPLDGVWKAKDGRITPYTGDGSAAIDFAWQVDTSNLPDIRRLRRLYEAALPSTYELDFPSKILRALFPHWELPPGDEGEAYMSMVDACFVASVIRSSTPGLRREYPLIAILPQDPSHETATNQGKGLLSWSVASAFAPGIEPITAPDSSSSPDVRAIAHKLRVHGTLALDEFCIPTARSHILSRDNLQSLCTGGVVPSGKVYENSGDISLSHSLVIAAKWLDLAEDLINRTIPLFLSELSDAQRAKTTIKTDVESGAVGLRLRLAAVALAEAIAEAPAPQLDASHHSWRFVAHRQLAAAILRGRTDKPWEQCVQLLDSTAEQIKINIAHHMELADNSGVSSTTMSGHNIRVTWPGIWEGLDDTTMSNIIATIGPDAVQMFEGHACVTLSTLLKARLTSCGMPGHRYAPIVAHAMGKDIRASNTAILKSVLANVRSFFRVQIADGSPVWVPLPGDLFRFHSCVVLRPGAGHVNDQTLISLKRVQ